MTKELLIGAQNARRLIARLGRASTPTVPDQDLKFRTHAASTLEDGRYPVMVIGSCDPLQSGSLDLVVTHPNSVLEASKNISSYQALVVNCGALKGAWSGSLSGWAGWKTDIIYEVCRLFRSEQTPVYLIRPKVETTAYKRWASLSSAVFPGFYSVAENSGNRNTMLWNQLADLEEQL